jgi:hypothetical protein
MNNNRLIIALFILFLFIIFLSSLQTVAKSHKAPAPSTPKSKAIELVTQTPTPIPTALPSPTIQSAPTSLPVQLPQYRINRGFGGDD